MQNTNITNALKNVKIGDLFITVNDQIIFITHISESGELIMGTAICGYRLESFEYNLSGCFMNHKKTPRTHILDLDHLYNGNDYHDVCLLTKHKEALREMVIVNNSKNKWAEALHDEAERILNYITTNYPVL